LVINMKKYIIPAMIYLIGSTTGCATTNNINQKDNLDSLLQEEVNNPKIKILQDNSSQKTNHTRYREIKTEDISQYFLSDKELEEENRHIEPVFDMDAFYAKCKDNLRGTPPPYSHFSCIYEKGKGKCQVTLEGINYQIEVPASKLETEGPLAAYHTFIQKPGQLEQIAGKHCAPQEFAYAPERI